MNWGTKLTIGMLLFMGFIVTLVILMVGPHKADALIDNDYYEKGQSFDLDYNAKQAAKDDNMIPVVKSDSQGLLISFAQEVSYDILFRRLSDSKLDKAFKSDSMVQEISIPPGKLKSGSWLLTIRFRTKQRNYLYQNKILLP